MNINFWGTVYGVKHFLPMLKREQRAHIVNVSSVFGLIAPPGRLRIPPASLRCGDLRKACGMSLRGRPVRVSCVHPGGIKTRLPVRARVGAGVKRTGLEENVTRPGLKMIPDFSLDSAQNPRRSHFRRSRNNFSNRAAFSSSPVLFTPGTDARRRAIAVLIPPGCTQKRRTGVPQAHAAGFP